MMRALAVTACLALTCMHGASPRCRCEGAARQGDWIEAKARCAESFSASKNPSDATLLAKAELNLGNEADAFAAARLGEEGPLRGEALEVEGIVLDRWGQVEAARAALEEARSIFRANDDAHEEARAAYALAGSFYSAAMYSETLTELDAAERAAGPFHDTRMQGYVSLMRADVLRMVGDAAAAERAYADASIQLGTESSDMALVDLKLGILHMDTGRLGLARSLFEDAVEKARPSQRRLVIDAASINLAWIDHKEGKTDAGFARLDAYRGAHDYDYLFTQSALQGDGGDLEAALWSLELAELDATNDDRMWEIANARGLLLERKDFVDDAEDAFRDAVQGVEKIRAAMNLPELQVWMIPKRREPYENLFALLAKGEQTAAAVEVLDSFTARSFVDSLIRGGAADSRITSRKAQASLIRRLAEGTVSHPSHAFPPREDVLVNVEAGGKVWVVHESDDRVTIVEVGSRDDILPLVASVEANVDNALDAEKLGEILVPVTLVPRQEGRSTRVLRIVATGSFVGLPYAALRRRERFLVEDRAIALAPSLGALALSPTSNPVEGSLVFANADGSLPAAEDEAREVVRQLKKLGAAEALVGPAARSTAIPPGSSYAVLHFGLHAGTDGGEPWLRFADRTWSGPEILDGGVRADLVVLASCASASTRHDELWGSLAASFLANRSTSVLAALGSVGDGDAHDVVVATFAKMGEKELGSARDPVQALAYAQRGMIAAGKEPSAWAPFVVYQGGGAPP